MRIPFVFARRALVGLCALAVVSQLPQVQLLPPRPRRARGMAAAM